jgi:hypothetical protein
MFSNFEAKLANFWDQTKAFFKRSEVIFYARLQMLAGFFLAVAGSIDWTSITSLNWTTPKQTIWAGVAIVFNGFITELLRRRNMTTGV